MGAPFTEHVMPLLEIGGTSYRRFNAFVGNWGHLHNKKKVFVGMGAPFTEHVMPLLEIGGTIHTKI